MIFGLTLPVFIMLIGGPALVITIMFFYCLKIRKEKD